MHRESNLIIFQQDATYSVYYISVGSCTRFGCWHPSSGARTTVNINIRSCNCSCASSWWCVSTPETCRVAYRNVINWISRILLENYEIRGRILCVLGIRADKYIIDLLFYVLKGSETTIIIFALYTESQSGIKGTFYFSCILCRLQYFRYKIFLKDSSKNL